MKNTDIMLSIISLYSSQMQIWMYLDLLAGLWNKACHLTKSRLVTKVYVTNRQRLRKYRLIYFRMKKKVFASKRGWFLNALTISSYLRIVEIWDAITENIKLYSFKSLWQMIYFSVYCFTHTILLVLYVVLLYYYKT